MLLTRALRKQICRLLIGVLLFAQFAVAGYACPGLAAMTTMAHADAMSSMAMNADETDGTLEKSSAMSPGCDQMDPDPGAANLCAEHCRFGQQSADTAPLPVVLAPVPALLYSLPSEPESISGSIRSCPAFNAVHAARPPPHAILHCVFRI
jgi:hypothetical protein